MTTPTQQHPYVNVPETVSKVKLDLYEGMIHNFPDRIPDAPEAIAARQKMRAFLHQHLGP